MLTWILCALCMHLSWNVPGWFSWIQIILSFDNLICERWGYSNFDQVLVTSLSKVARLCSVMMSLYMLTLLEQLRICMMLWGRGSQVNSFNWRTLPQPIHVLVQQECVMTSFVLRKEEVCSIFSTCSACFEYLAVSYMLFLFHPQ